MVQKSRTFLPGAACSLLVLAVLLAVFRITYRCDNKYTAGPPYGQAGVFSFTEQDLKEPLFLVDGWLLAVNDGPEAETFIGEYSNFSFSGRSGDPFGKATYRLTLRCPGTHALLLELPEVFSEYTLWLNETPLANTGSGSMVELLFTDEAQLTLEVENHTHYYSGLYYPPALGTPAQMVRLAGARLVLYTAFCISALTLAAFSCVLWLTRARDGLFLHFGFLCLSFFTLCLHPFVWKAGLNSPWWYALEDTARLMLLAQAVEVSAALCGWAAQKAYRRYIRPTLAGVCAVCFICVAFIIPNFGGIINVYGVFVDLVNIAGWAMLCACTAASLQKGAPGAAPLAGGCCALGAGALINLLNNNRFEPISGAWQTEYAGFCMVLLFGAVMICHNRNILLQNRRLVAHMEELVQQRTAELSAVLTERKNFFSDMAHNLKAPIAAVHGFISLIREGNLYLDDELREYISLIESENEEIRRRVQSLSALNSFDQITTPRGPLVIDELLGAIYQKNAPDVGVMGVHFYVEKLGKPAYIHAQREKLLTLFENLIYNALAFTPPEGCITIHPWLQGSELVIEVADTGRGIAPDQLPHIFERFYVGRENKNEGSGLGLYIAQITVEELGGSITARSAPGRGTTFQLRLPLAPSVLP